ncbi:MAG: single-stranded DNA-binding protein [Oscillospiraceae bacterium]|jgi:single-strand DNA-binding protein|nr:single-stranded DNA-binding protein [Oscillospiraceae bacterium]
MFIDIGRLTQDTEVKTVTVNGAEKHVLNNRLAVKNGKDDTTFIDATAWNNIADFIGTFFKKGDELFVEGELRNRTIKSGDKEFTAPYLLLTRVKFTHGNKNLEDYV